MNSFTGTQIGNHATVEVIFKRLLEQFAEESHGRLTPVIQQMKDNNGIDYNRYTFKDSFSEIVVEFRKFDMKEYENLKNVTPVNIRSAGSFAMMSSIVQQSVSGIVSMILVNLNKKIESIFSAGSKVHYILQNTNHRTHCLYYTDRTDSSLIVVRARI